LILDGESPYALNVARCLRAGGGVRTHVLSTRPRSVVRFSRAVDSLRIWDGVAHPGAAERFIELARELPVDLCLATDEAGVEFISRQGPRLGVPCVAVPTLPALQVALDKWELAGFLAAHGLPHPSTELITRGDASRSRIACLQWPLLLKPRSGGNGRGIRRCESIEQLYDLADSAHLWEATVAQSEVPGYDIDCSVLCRNGQVLAYTIQRGFIETAHFRPPVGIEFLHDERVIEVVRKLMAALRWSGVAHVDLRCDSRTDTINIIEVNPRFWGSVLGSVHAGVNFPHLACLSALGRPIAPACFRACRYVAGSAAWGSWRRGVFARSATGFAFTDTLFWYARHDPLPALIELFQKGP